MPLVITGAHIDTCALLCAPILFHTGDTVPAFLVYRCMIKITMNGNKNGLEMVKM